jgi:DNA-binding transcriptional LysR family regulator
MGDFKRYETFLAVVDHRSFTSAAIKLGTTKAKASRHVAELEESLQVALLKRNTRKVELTDLGESYARDCRAILVQVAHANAAVRAQHGAVAGKLRIQAPPALGNQHLSLLWGAFCMQHAEVQLEVDLCDFAATHANSKEWDLQIQVGHLADSGFVAQTLAKTEVVLCAAPAYLAQMPAMTSPADIAQHRMIIDTTDPAEPQWSLTDAGRKTALINLNGMKAMRCNSTEACLNQTISGYGLSYLPMYIVQKHLASGALQRVLPEYSGRVATISVLYHSRKHLSSTMRAMIEFLQRAFADKKWV